MPEPTAIAGNSFRYAGTPEQLLVVNPKAPHRLYSDALSCILDRAKAIVVLLEANGQGNVDGFDVKHEYIADALWALEGLLEEARAILRHGEGG